MKLGDMLVEHGLINATQLNTALQNQRQFGGRLGANLVMMGFVSEEQLARTLAQQLRIPFIEDSVLSKLDPALVSLVPAQLAINHSCVPIARQGQTLTLAMSDPADIEQLDAVRFALDRPVRAAIACQSALRTALVRHYGAVSSLREAELPHGEPYLGRTTEVDLPPPEVVALRQASSKASAHTSDFRPRLVAAANVRDVADAMVAELAGHFQALVLLALRDNVAAAVLAVPAKELGQRQVSAAAAPIAASIQRKQMIHQVEVTDPELRGFCEGLGMSPRHVTVLPIFQDQAPLFVVVAQGLDKRVLIEQHLPSVKVCLAKASLALKLVALKRELMA